MYEKFFNFTQRPFTAVPRVDRYYPGESIEGARVALARCIDRAAGCALMLGPTGAGKTLLCQVLAEQFRNSLVAVHLSGTRITSRKALLQAILFELGIAYRRREEGELRLSLIDYLTPGPDRPEGMLLLVDEAHTLPLKLCEELRLLTNIVRQGKSRVRLVLAGSSSLEERLAHPKLAPFQQRIAVRVTLLPLAAGETQEYVRAQVAAAGGDAEAIWTDEALSTVHKISGGIPRVINQVCDHALLLAAAAEQEQIDARAIDEAWADLQQLPLSGRPAAMLRNVDPAANSTEESVIEFGALDDDPPASSRDQRAVPAVASTAVIPLASMPLTTAAGDDVVFEEILDEIDEEDLRPSRPNHTVAPPTLALTNAEPAGTDESADSDFDAFDEEEVPDRIVRPKPRRGGSPGPTTPRPSTPHLAPRTGEDDTWTQDEEETWLAVPAAHAATGDGRAEIAAQDPVMPEEEEEMPARRRVPAASRRGAKQAKPAVVPLRAQGVSLFGQVPIIVEDDPPQAARTTKRIVTVDVVHENQTSIVLDKSPKQTVQTESRSSTARPEPQPTATLRTAVPPAAGKKTSERPYKHLFSRMRRNAT